GPGAAPVDAEAITGHAEPVRRSAPPGGRGRLRGAALAPTRARGPDPNRQLPGRCSRWRDGTRPDERSGAYPCGSDFFGQVLHGRRHGDPAQGSAQVAESPPRYRSTDPPLEHLARALSVPDGYRGRMGFEETQAARIIVVRIIPPGGDRVGG